MERQKRDAILVRLTEALHERESWCGETHLQKASYFLQEMVGAKMGFDFILYKHGPFSFDLRDELSAMRAIGLVDFRVQHPSYGPSIVPSPDAKSLKHKFPKTLRRHEHFITFVADKFKAKPVVELEKLGTAFYVLRELGNEATDEKCAERIHQLKPHIPVEQATDALRTVREWNKEASELAACL